MIARTSQPRVCQRVIDCAFDAETLGLTRFFDKKGIVSATEHLVPERVSSLHGLSVTAFYSWAELRKAKYVDEGWDRARRLVSCP